jgi:hypothetical protein
MLPLANFLRKKSPLSLFIKSDDEYESEDNKYSDYARILKRVFLVPAIGAVNVVVLRELRPAQLQVRGRTQQGVHGQGRGVEALPRGQGLHAGELLLWVQQGNAQGDQ